MAVRFEMPVAARVGVTTVAVSRFTGDGVLARNSVAIVNQATPAVDYTLTLPVTDLEPGDIIKIKNNIDPDIIEVTINDDALGVNQVAIEGMVQEIVLDDTFQDFEMIYVGGDEGWIIMTY